MSAARVNNICLVALYSVQRDVCVVAENVQVPIVLLVVDGGENTLETVLQALRVSTPVVVIGSSGRAADFIEAGMRLTKHKHKVYVDISRY
jgi:glycerate kinase